MEKIYNVYHIYDVDGGFGDAITKKKLLFTTSNKEVAEEFVTKYSNKHVYDAPYNFLYEGGFIIEEGLIISSFDEIPEDIIKLGEEMKEVNTLLSEVYHKCGIYDDYDEEDE